MGKKERTRTLLRAYQPNFAIKVYIQLIKQENSIQTSYRQYQYIIISTNLMLKIPHYIKMVTFVHV